MSRLKSVLIFASTVSTLFCLAVVYQLAQKSAAYSQSIGITDIAGVKVGHHTLEQRPTGCTVVLVEEGAVGGVDVRGFAPGTRETDLLDPVNTVQQIHAISLAGGSAFGLDAASGVVRYLEERGKGLPIGSLRIPIVSAAVLFDLQVGDKPEIRPNSNCGYRAAQNATSGPVPEGNVGAGAGATVGKLLGLDRAMKSGVGTYSVTLPNGIKVGAIVVVNAVGSVVDPKTGNVIAGIRTQNGQELLDIHEVLREGQLSDIPFGGNTTIGVVATNASLTQAQATQVARMAHDGLARSIVPAHTPIDGDTLFAVATGQLDSQGNLIEIGSLAAEVTSQAIIRAVTYAEGIPSYPALRDLANQ